MAPFYRGRRETEAVTPRVTLFPNYLHYKLNQASSASVNQAVEVRNQNSKSIVLQLMRWSMLKKVPGVTAPWGQPPWRPSFLD
jgi:hypothetical protein